MEELSYAIVTPYSMRKSRTGGIVARLISRTGLDVVAGRMFAPSAELVNRYVETIVTETQPRHRATQELIKEYVRRNFTGKVNGQRPRVLLLVFRGEDAVAKVHHTVGHIVNERTSGETIRDTFGDYIADESGKVIYFEPAVLTAIHPEQVEQDLKLWAEFSDRDGGILENVIDHRPGANVEKTLVLIKPDNFKYPNLRPGGVIEVFSRTGLYIIGFKVHRMSVAQAESFYGPVLGVLQEKLGIEKGREAWEDIVEFMSGGRPSADRRRTKERVRDGKMHCACVSRRGRSAENSRSAGPDRSEQGAARLDSKGIRPNDHDQRSARFRLDRERAA